MLLEIKLNNGIEIESDVANYEPEEFADKLNDVSIHSLKIGNYLWNRHAFSYILSKSDLEEFPNVDIYLTNGSIISLSAENYIGDEILTVMNDPRRQFVLIGNSIFNKTVILGIEDKRVKE